MQITFATYNIRKAIGVDRRRDPGRILAILNELDADVVALQEADRRLGNRRSALPLPMLLEHTDYRPAPVALRPESIGWHGNALLVRRGIAIEASMPLFLPTLEPRGAIRADLRVKDQPVTVIGMHLDLSGLWRRRQIRSVLDASTRNPGHYPTVLLGDLNQWSRRGAIREFGGEWNVLTPGRSFPSRRPFATLDRIIASNDWEVTDSGVHRSALAKRGSDHLPVWASLRLPKN